MSKLAVRGVTYLMVYGPATLTNRAVIAHAAKQSETIRELSLCTGQHLPAKDSGGIKCV